MFLFWKYCKYKLKKSGQSYGLIVFTNKHFNPERLFYKDRDIYGHDIYNSFFWVGSLFFFWGLINGWTNSYANGGQKNICIDSKQNVGKLLLGQVMLFAVLLRHYGFHVYNV